ncbi:MAG TPA: sigma factor [Pyrinomonadaceae bacterium]
MADKLSPFLFEPNPQSAGLLKCMSDEASQREGWWVLQAQSGSHEALNELFKSVQEPLFRYIVSLVRDQHQAEDILQEVFIRIYRKLRWLREPQAFRAWTY